MDEFHGNERNIGGGGETCRSERREARSQHRDGVVCKIINRKVKVWIDGWSESKRGEKSGGGSMERR